MNVYTFIVHLGYTDERKGLWRETCTGLRSQLSDPYLRAMFAFLTDDADSYDPVLVRNKIIACVHRS